MNSIKDIEKSIVEEFEMFDNWTQKYEYLIDISKELPKMDSNYKTDENIIKGCQSKVWLHADSNNKKIIYIADSDAIMTKGIIALLIRLFSNQKYDDILNCNLDFIEKIGLKDQLSQTRANGLLAMIKKMKLYALTFKHKYEHEQNK